MLQHATSRGVCELQPRLDNVASALIRMPDDNQTLTSGRGQRRGLGGKVLISILVRRADRHATTGPLECRDEAVGDGLAIVVVGVDDGNSVGHHLSTPYS